MIAASGADIALLLFQFGNKRALGLEDRPKVNAPLFFEAATRSVRRRVSGQKVRDLIQRRGGIDGERERIAGANQRHALQPCGLLQGLLALVLA
jgi:hypothetical protein